MNKQDLTVLPGSKEVMLDVANDTCNQISERDLPTALGFLARILDEMRGVHKNCSIQGTDSLISYDEACTAYKTFLIRNFSA